MTTRTNRPAEAAPDGLSPQIVIDAALRLMDEHGVEWLSTRKLAAHLGVSAQALYWYFPSKDALCRAVVASASQELGVVPLGRGTPRKRLERYMGELRTHWKRHPSVLTLGRRYPPTAAGAVAAQGVALLEEMGFPEKVAMARHRAIIWIVLGFVYVEQGVTQSAHHEPISGTIGRYEVRVAGNERADQSFDLDTDRLFTEIVRNTLAGLEAELRI